MAGLEGRSLLPFLGAKPPARETGEAFRFAFAGAGGGTPLTHYRTVQDRSWQLAFHPPRTNRKGEELPALYELYDLTSDPLAAHDLAAANPQQTQRMTQALAKWMNGRLWIHPPKGLANQASEATLKALKALGYVD